MLCSINKTNELFQLETRLADKEESLLEKDLVFEQVTRLVGRVRNKAENGKDDTLDLAKKVGSLKGTLVLCLKIITVLGSNTLRKVLALL